MNNDLIRRSEIKRALLGWDYDPSDEDLECAIDSLPAVDAVEVVHAKWVEWWPPKNMILTGEEVLFVCSKCTAKYDSKENMRYCPNCGARMDGE